VFFTDRPRRPCWLAGAALGSGGTPRTQKLVRQLRPCTSSTRRNIFRYESLSFCAARGAVRPAVPSGPGAVSRGYQRRPLVLHSSRTAERCASYKHRTRCSALLLLLQRRTFCRSASDTSNTRPFRPSDAICDARLRVRFTQVSQFSHEKRVRQAEGRRGGRQPHTRLHGVQLSTAGAPPWCPACA